MNNSGGYPCIELILTIGTWGIDAFANLDTGLDGGLLIPIGVGRQILASPDEITLRLPDNSYVKADSWDGTIEVEWRGFMAEVAAIGSRFLLGREVLDKMGVCFEFGQEVTIRFRD